MQSGIPTYYRNAALSQGQGDGGMSAQKAFGLGSGAAGIGAGLYGLFGDYNNPSESAMPYLNQIPGAASQHLMPWEQAGAQTLSQLQGQYGSLVNNPGQKLNQMGSNFQQSPGFQFALQQALQGAGHAAAAGGMAGSPQHEQQNMQLATNLGNQDYYNWLGHATGLYGEGLHGLQGMSQQGQQAGGSLADLISQNLSERGNLAYQGAANANMNQSNAFNNLFSGLGNLAAFAAL